MGYINYTFFSKALREQTRIAVVLPTYERGNPEKRDEFYQNAKKLRTLYVLHGGSDDCTFYLRNTGIERYAQEGGFALVLPEVRNSFYCDMYKGQKYLTYLSEELPEVVQTVFPLSDKKEDHFVVGNSMGSHGTFKWALNCPNFFNAAAGMSGAGDVEDLGFFKPLPDGSIRDTVENAFGSPEIYRGSRNDLKTLAKNLVDSGAYIPRLYSCCGTEDPYGGGAVMFAEYAKEIGLPLEWHTGPGAHTWQFWDTWLKVIIPWMGLADKVQ